MRRFWFWWLVSLVFAILLPHTVSAYTPTDVQITSPGSGVHYLSPGDTLNVTVQYASQPAVANSTVVGVELYHGILYTVVAANSMAAPDGVGQTVTVPLVIPAAVGEGDSYRVRARVISSDSPVEGTVAASGGAFVVDTTPPVLQLLMPGAGDAPMQPLGADSSSPQIQIWARIYDVYGVTVQTEFAPAGSGVWTQRPQMSVTAKGSPVLVGVIPTATLADGLYDVRVTATDGTGRQTVAQGKFELVAAAAAVPDAPRNLQAEPLTGAVRLSWDAPAGGAPVQWYRVLRNGAEVKQALGATGADVVTNDTDAVFEIEALNTVGASARATIQASPLAVPLPPAGISVTPDWGWNKVSWMTSPDIPTGVIVRYRIYRDGVLLVERSPYSYYDNTATPGTTHNYHVTAFTAAGGESLPSPPAAVTTNIMPDQPGTPALTATTEAGGSVTLSWLTVDNLSDGAMDGYNVVRDGQWLDWVTYPATTWKDFAATSGMTYTYAIEACNASDCSDQASVTITAGAEPQAPDPGAAPEEEVGAGEEAGAGEDPLATVSEDTPPVDDEADVPRAAVRIDADGPAVSQRAISLTLAVQNAPSGVSSMRLATDGVTWTDWEAFQEQRDYILPPGDGRKSVYVQFRDSVGNHVASAQTGTMLDTTPPAGLAVLETISESETQVHAQAYDSLSGVTEKRYATDTGDWSDWEPYRPVWRVPHVAGQSAPPLRVQFRDMAGNAAEATVVPAPDGPQREATTAGGPPEAAPSQLPIGSAQPVAVAPLIPDQGSAEIEVQWSATPWPHSEIAGVRLYYTTDGGTTWAAFGDVFQHSPIRFAAPEEGTYGFAVRPEPARALEGKPALPAGPADIQSVTSLDLTPPTGSVRVNDGAAATPRAEVLLLLTATDQGAGVVTMRFSPDRENWTGWETYRPVRRWVLTPGSGSRKVFVQFQDQAGNISEAIAGSIRLEPDPLP